MRGKIVALMVVALVMALVFEAVILTASPESLSIMGRVMCGSDESMSIDRVYHAMNSYSLTATCYHSSTATNTVSVPLVILAAYTVIFLPTFLVLWAGFDVIAMMSATPVLATETESTVQG